jgi:MFS family permease
VAALHSGNPTPVLSKSYKRYALAALTAVCTLNYLDRGLIILLLQPIKEDLHLSDTQLGFLTGIAFGLFYAVLGLPIARWADRGNRVTITSAAIGLWGLTVMLCLLVTNFAQLLTARIAAAIGEAGCMPPTYSLLGDYFPGAAERTRAMAIYWLASPLAALISFMIGGELNHRFGWRLTFFIMGIPALVLAALVKFTLREPRHSPSALATTERQPSAVSVLKILWNQRSSRHLIVAIVLLWTLGLGMAPWYAAFMIRSHGMQTAELGIWFGLIFGVGSAAGILLGGFAATRWYVENERGQMQMSAIMVGALFPCYAAFLLLPQKWQALTALVPLMFVFSLFAGPTFAIMQRLVVAEMRATSLAIVMLLANLIGMGLGPEIVGSLSDLLRPIVGADSLRDAMLALSVVALWSAYHFWQVGSTVSEDLSAVVRRAGE